MKTLFLLPASAFLALTPVALAKDFSGKPPQVVVLPDPAANPLGFVEDRTFDDEFKGPPKLPGPSGILISTTIGERIVSSFESFQPTLVHTFSTTVLPAIVSSQTIHQLIGAWEDSLGHAYAMEDTKVFHDMLSLIVPVAMDKGIASNVWNQPVVALRDHGSRLSDVLSAGLAMFVLAGGEAEIDAAVQVTQAAISQEYLKLAKDLAALGTELKTGLGKGANLSMEIDLLTDLLKSGPENAHAVLHAQIIQLGKQLKADASFFFRPEIDDEVVIGITVGNEADVLEFLKWARSPK